MKIKKRKFISILLIVSLLVTLIPEFSLVSNADSEEYLWPVDGVYHMSRGYGLDGSEMHRGIDIQSGDIKGKVVRASRSGEVIDSSNACPHDNSKRYGCNCNGGRGNYVYIRHDDGTVTRYLHLLQGSATTATHVEQGDQIGLVGSSGDSTGPHLHFDICPNGDTSLRVNNNPSDSRHTYGVKSNYGAGINYIYERGKQLSVSITPTCAYVKVTKAGGCKLWDEPNDNNGSSTSVNPSNAYNGQTLTITGYCENTKGNVWYRTNQTYNGSYLWVYSKNVSFSRFATNNEVFSFSNVGLASYTINKGNSCYFAGTIGTAVSGMRFNVTSSVSGGYINNNTMSCISSCSLRGSAIDKATKFNILPLGNYTFSVKASCSLSFEDSNKCLTVHPVEKSESKSFSIVNSGGGSVTPAEESYCNCPTFSISEDYGRKCVTIRAGTNQNVTSYKVTKNGAVVKSESSLSYPQIAYEMNQEGTYVITATASRSGYKSATSSTTVVLGKATTPNISYVQTSKNVKITIKGKSNARIRYTTDGSDPTNGKIYNGTISMSKACTVKAIAEEPGCVASNISTKSVTVSPPSAPSLTRVSNAKIASGDNARVKWNAVDLASSYTATLYDSRGSSIKSTSTSGTSAQFILPEVGTYTIRVKANNFAGSSVESYAVNITAMPPSTVTFCDWDNTVLNTQTVRYGYSATAPKSPSRKGYTFAGWGSRGFNNITEDTSFTAEYDINYYTVRFYNPDGSLLSTQHLHYLDKAEIPEPVTSTGYAFAGWNVSATDSDSECNLEAIDSDMKVTAVQVWENEDLPVEVEIDSATRDSTTGNYSVKTLLKAPEGKTITALLRVSLKNEDQQLIKTTSREVQITTGAQEQSEETVTLVCSEMATYAEVELLKIVDDNKTGSAYSRAVTKDLIEVATDTWSDWSEWVVNEPSHSDSVQIETQNQYRFQTKKTTTSTSRNIGEGWTLTDSSFTWGDYGLWSNWSSGIVKSNEFVNVQERNAYRYYYYECPECGSHTYNAGSGCCYKWAGGCGSDVPKTSYKYIYNDISYDNTDEWYDVGVNYTYSSEDGLIFAVTDEDNSDYCNPVKQYRYQTRIKNYLYTFTSWSDWSEWSDTKYVASSTQNVEERKVYRSRTKGGNRDASATAKKYSVSGILDDVDSDLEGKLATIMVYNTKNTDPNEDQLQYIGQTVIKKNNVYSFQFIPKSDPTAESGDYVVALGIEGSTGLVNVDLIEAPSPTYNVTFQNDDGTVISTQTIEEGHNAVIPSKNPEKDGYTFVAWSTTPVNVHNDMVVTALYSPETYVVVYADYVNDQVGFNKYVYNQELTVPYTPSATGYTFNGWKKEDGTFIGEDDLVTGDMILTADYTPDTYTVTFSDGNGGIFETQPVKYGESANLPDSAPTVEGKTFVGWSNDSNWWNVTGDITVEPIMVYENTAIAPTYSVEKIEDVVVIDMQTSTDDGVIHYTTDGSEPDENSDVLEGNLVVTDFEYSYDYEDSLFSETTIEVTRTATIKAYTSSPDKNDSEVITIAYEDTEVVDYEEEVDEEEYSTISLSSAFIKPGETGKMNVSVSLNPGIAGYVLYMKYDATALTIDNVEASAGKYFTKSDYKNEEGQVIGSKFVYAGDKNITEDGTLFTFDVTVSNDANKDYSIELTTDDDGIVNADGETQFLYLTPGVIYSKTLRGDVNSDGNVTNGDAVMILRSLIDLEVLSSTQELAADFNGDGDVTMFDAILIVKSIIGIE